MPEIEITRNAPAYRIGDIGRVIESAEELDALPDRTIIRTGYDTAAQKSDDVWEYPNEVGQFTSESVDLPATVLWRPEVDRG